MINKASIQAARQALAGAGSVAVISHTRPDGDAIGSLIALGLALKDAGKDVQMILEDGVPSTFRYLEGSRAVSNTLQQPVDMIIVIDCGDEGRIGRVLPEGQTVHLNIDHHYTNLGFAEINLVDPDSPATAEMLTQYMEALGLAITSPIRDALLTGILTDTQGFKTPNTRPLTLRLAAELYEMGADLPGLTFKALSSKTFEALRYWGSGLVKLQREAGLVWSSLSLIDRRQANYPGRDDADLVNALSAVEDAEISLLMIEQENSTVKISWRSRNGIDVASIAQQFGGGGHKAAAGAIVEGALSEVQNNIVQSTLLAFHKYARTETV